MKKHLGDQDISGKDIMRVNAKFVAATVLGGYGWLIWQMASVEWWGFYLIGPMAFLGGALLSIQALYQSYTLIKERGRWKRFIKQAGDPKADPMAQDEDLRAGGHLS